MPRLLLGLAASQVLGILLASWGAFPRHFPELLGLLTFFLALIALRFGSPPRLLAAFACLAVFCAGATAYQSRQWQARWPFAQANVELTLEGRVTLVASGQGWFRLRLCDVVAVSPVEHPPPSTIEIRGVPFDSDYPSLHDVVRGQRLRFRARLRPVRSLQNPGGTNRERRLQREGIGAVAQLLHPALLVEMTDGEAIGAQLWRGRKRLAEKLLRLSPGGGILTALALGDRRGLSAERKSAIRNLGLAHLLAVSGLHLGLVGAGAYAVVLALLSFIPALAARFDLRTPASWTAVLAAAGYAFLAGWGVPVRRALVLLVALLLGFIFGRSRLRFHPLALASILILALDPGALFDPGYQMSFAASSALLISVARKPVELERRSQSSLFWAVRGLTRVSIVAFAATAPIAATCFGALAPAGIVVNLVAIPWVAFGLLPAALLATGLVTLAAFWTSPGIDFTLRAIAWIADVSAKGAVSLGSVVPTLSANPQPVFGFLLVAIFFAGLTAFATSTRSKFSFALACALVLGIAPPRALRPEPPRVVFLDVGKGDAILIQGREGVVLVDAGTSFEDGHSMGDLAVVPALRALGIARIDVLVASHADRDHQGGLAAVLRSVPVGALWLPYSGLGDPAFDPLRAIAKEGGVAVTEHGAGDSPREVGDLRIEPLWPPVSPTAFSRNDASLVLRATLPGGLRFLLAGDLEARGERGLLRLEPLSVGADWLKLGHHGSRTSSSRSFLQSVGARDVLVSAGCDERFGMPHRKVLERLPPSTARIWWTGRDGAVLVGAAGSVRGFRGEDAACPDGRVLATGGG